MPDVLDELIECGKNLLRYATGQIEDVPSLPITNGKQYLTRGEPVPPGSPLQTLFTQLDPKDGRAKASPAYFQVVPLKGSAEIFPKKERPIFSQAELTQYWNAFEAEEPYTESFEAFCYLLRRYAWCLPAPYGNGDISLYEYFKLVASLRCCEAAGEEVILVSGAVSGIQSWLYTIQSSKATQTLRGRSFYLQLISDGIARRLLHRFDVPRTNLIYQGGGNFSLLLPSKLNGEAAEEILKKEKTELEQTLWDDYNGDLSLSLVWQVTDVTTFLDPAKNQELYNKLNQKLLRNRATRFTNLTHEALFKPMTKGWEDIPTDESDDDRDERLTKPNEPYLDLAAELNKVGKEEQAWLVITPTDELSRTKVNEDVWSDSLEKLSKHRYQFIFDKEVKHEKGNAYAINRTEGIFQQGGDGFIFIGNVIPRVNDRDLERWEAQPAEVKTSQGKTLKPGGIRDFGLLANSARGIQRYGVLRMDVDNLGKKLLREWLPEQPGPLARATVSSLLGLFFEGYLNQICREINDQTKNERGDTLYLIYSGGDDLFVVGAWDRLPELAVRVREEFKLYTCNPKVTISGGITVADSKSYPLYQAAEDADKAEKQAKAHKVSENDDKNALSFLRVPLKWDEFSQVEEYCQKLVDLTEKKEGGRPEAPRALLNNLLDLDRQARYGAATANKAGLEQPRQLTTGRWYWRAAYNLKRTMQRVEDRAVRQRIEQISDAALKEGRLQLVGLAARWTHLLTRTSQED